MLGGGTSSAKARKINLKEVVTLGQPLGSEERASRTGRGLEEELGGHLGKV